MATVTESSLSTIKKKTERGERGFPGPAGPVTGGVYPGAGIAVSTGAAWGASITNNSANWNTAYGWGNHASAGYAPVANPTFTGNVGIGIAPGDSQQKLQVHTASNTNLSIRPGSDFGAGYSGSAIDSLNDAITVRKMLILAGNPIVMPGGNVGIGTTTPLSKLTINGNDGSAREALDVRGTTTSTNATAGIAAMNINATSSLDVGHLSTGSSSNYIQRWLKGNGTTDPHSSVVAVINTSGNVGIGFTSPLGKLCIDGGLHVGGASDPGDNNLLVDGIAQEPHFISGWQGNNWQIQADGDAEFNNVLIRGGLSVYELIINQLHYQNGGLIIGAGAGKIDTIVSGTAGSEVLTFHDPEGNDMVPFSAGAIVMCLRVDINRTDVVKKIVRRVASISGMEVTLATTTGWTTGDDTGVFETGDEVCAIGHLTNDSLDSCIYMSATDADNPFLRVLDGVNSYSKFSLGDKTTVKLQIGNLLSLASYDFLPSSPGYGLYCDNAYLNGRIVLPNAGMTNEGSSDSDIRIYAGSAYDDMATAPFRVTQNGSLTATGIAELGTATATVDGKASNVAIRGCDIWENAYNGDNSSLLINRIGYNGGTTKYRDFAVCNGKGSKLITVGGGTMNYVSFGNINYDDLEISLYGTCQNVWAKQLIYAYGGVSNNVLISWDTPASTTNTSYTKLKTFTLGAYLKPNRTLRLKFDLKATSNTSYATIYRNGSPVGTERITSSVSYVTYSEDISGWNPSDAIELYVKSSGAGNTASVQNFRICGDMITSIATELQATAS